MNPTIKNSEEHEGEIKIFLSNGHEVTFATESLIEYIEKNGLNITEVNQGTGLVCDPNSPDEYIEVVTPVDVFLDQYFDEMCSNYYLNVILKGK